MHASYFRYMAHALNSLDNPPGTLTMISADGDNLPVAPMVREWALFLDIDGTISDLAPAPEKAFIPEQLLLALNTISRGPLAFISGRSLSSIDKLTAPYIFSAAGQHGLEMRHQSGPIISAGKLSNTYLAEIARVIERLTASHPGLHLEHKGSSIAVHFRNVPEMENQVTELLQQLASRNENWCVQRGKMVAEIRPCGSDKGTAIEYFMKSPPFKGRIPVFAGDDETDEKGFRTVNALSGISIKVGDEPSLANYRVKKVETIRNWLQDILPFLVYENGRTS